MPNASVQQAFHALMQEYVDFLERMRDNERVRLEALQTRDLPRIESSIAASQANAKQLENFEMRRVSAQASAGYEGLSFQELVDTVPAEERAPLADLLARFESSVSDIRFYNNKSMAVARDGMREIDPSAVLPGQTPANQTATNPYQTMKQAQAEQTSSILETKI